MKRTFKGWIMRYSQSLTRLNTTSVKKLVQAMEAYAPQAEEAVFLYALECGKSIAAMRFIENENTLCRWKEMAALSKRYSKRAEAFLRKRHDILPIRYRKILNAFDSAEANAANDDRVVLLMAKQVNEALAASGITRYRLCKDLALNEGNIYAWLAGDATKVSRDTARRAWEYAEQRLDLGGPDSAWADNLVSDGHPEV